MALGRHTPLGDCVHYRMSRLQSRENKQKNELKGVILMKIWRSTALLYNHRTIVLLVSSN